MRQYLSMQAQDEKVWDPLAEREGHTYILNTFGKPVVADVAFALVLLRAVEPRDAFVDEPAEDFCPHEVCNRRPPSGGHIRHACGVAQQPSDQIERREDRRETLDNVEVWVGASVI